MRSGSSPAMAICSSASWPMTVWWRSTWLRTEPREYFVSGFVAATSLAPDTESDLVARSVIRKLELDETLARREWGKCFQFVVG